MSKTETFDGNGYKVTLKNYDEIDETVKSVIEDAINKKIVLENLVEEEKGININNIEIDFVERIIKFSGKVKDKYKDEFNYYVNNKIEEIENYDMVLLVN